MTRVYLPTFAELIDRLTIVQLKAIFIPQNKEAYQQEMSLIMTDIDTIIQEKNIGLSSGLVRTICMVMLCNRYIWENESKARAGGSEQDKLLKLTHSINGIRNTAKNMISGYMGERVDLKVDALAADLPEEFGNWKVF